MVFSSSSRFFLVGSTLKGGTNRHPTPREKKENYRPQECQLVGGYVSQTWT